MTTISNDSRLASRLVRSPAAVMGGGRMVNQESSYGSAAGGPLVRASDSRPEVASLLAALTTGTSLARDPRAARERFEEELRAALHARAVVIREDPSAPLPPPPNVICIAIPLGPGDGRARLEAVFDAPRPVDERIAQLMEAASYVAAILLELERAGGPFGHGLGRRPLDGAAPLIGASEAMKRLRDRIERVAATDFTVLIEGAIGPEAHPSFIGFFGEVTVGGGYWEVERAGEDGAEEVKDLSPDPFPGAIMRPATDV